jgi:hypothetical protein
MKPRCSDGYFAVTAGGRGCAHALRPVCLRRAPMSRPDLLALMDPSVRSLLQTLPLESQLNACEGLRGHLRRAFAACSCPADAALPTRSTAKLSDAGTLLLQELFGGSESDHAWSVLAVNEAKLLRAAAVWGTERSAEDTAAFVRASKQQAAERKDGGGEVADELYVLRCALRQPRLVAHVEDHRPVTSTALRLFDWHIGCALRGIVESLFTAGEGLRGGLRCSDGGFVTVTFSMPRAANLLREGAEVTILDPFYGVDSRGWRYVVVEHASDLIVRSTEAVDAKVAAERARQTLIAALREGNRLLTAGR